MSERVTTPGFSRRQWVSMVSGSAAVTALYAMPTVVRAQAAQPNPENDRGTRTYNIRDFGAVGDGKALDTHALQAAIDACTSDGGGTVLVPAGTFQIGATELKSNVTLHLAAGATLLGTVDGKQYHPVDAIPLSGDSTLGDGNWALLYGVDARNVTVEGPGTIDGQGFQFKSPQKGTPPPSGIGGAKRPYHLLFHKCQNLTVRNLTLVDCAFHSIRVIQSHYVLMDALHIHSRVNSNNDGFHFISCENVNITNCNIECQDDACALFGSCKFIMVSNCSFSTRWSVFRFGGGIAENVVVSNCIIYECYGCPFKLSAGPGARFENMAFSDIILKDVTGPIDITAGNRRARPNTTQPAPQAVASTPAATEPATRRAPALIRNISFSNIHGTVTTDPPQLRDTQHFSNYNPGEKLSAIVINAVDDAVIENISFNNVHLTFGGGGTAADGARRDVPEVSGEYFALGPIPAYGLYARGARALTLNNIRLEVAAPELRPAIIFERIDDASITSLSAQGNTDAESLLRFMNSTQVYLAAPRVLKAASTFLRVEGDKSDNILIDGGDLTRAATPLTFAGGAKESTVKLRT